ncbi:hypothetical protein EDB19DRAFT_1911354 [Suillus lakei]|nr:hypothetical protein EDB19DRAFT_1911354 [Suillus lakei]
MANSLDALTVPYPLYISSVSVDFSKSNKNVESAEVWIGRSPTLIERERGAGKALHRTFSPPMELSRGDTFSLHLRYKKWHGTKHEDIDFEPEDMFGMCGANERQGETMLVAPSPWSHVLNLPCAEYNKIHKNITIVVDLSGNPTTEAEQLVSSSGKTLQPTTDEISRICPRFRILVIGKTGVGKSSLINHIFGVQNALASHNKPGEASIDHELISPQNERFVLHDSKGFEPGEEVNFKVVRNFIDRRRAMRDLKDQLHAIWLCFEIPFADGRLLETATEMFLSSKREGKLGNIPIVVVFTKYDKLLGRMERTLDESSLKSLSEDDIKERTKKSAQDKLQDVCIAPLEKSAGPDIPHVTVSTNGNHEETLAHLIQTTEELVCKHVATEASVMTSIAQRVDPGLKIKASIEVGKRKYWKAARIGRGIQEPFDVWNFRDPHGVIALLFVSVACSDEVYMQYLCSPEFRKLMANMVDELDVGPIADLNKNITFGLSIVGTIATIVSALSGPCGSHRSADSGRRCDRSMGSHGVSAIAIVSRVTLQRFMKYIIDLTLVLQILYLVAGKKELSRRAIKLAVKSYHDSPTSGDVHNRIREYDRQLTFLERADRDSLDQFVELLQSYTISVEEMPGLRERFSAVDLSLDEPWETVGSHSI